MSEHATTPLHQALNEMLDQYFSNLEGAQPNRVHEMVISAVEKPLFEYITRRREEIRAPHWHLWVLIETPHERNLTLRTPSDQGFYKIERHEETGTSERFR